LLFYHQQKIEINGWLFEEESGGDFPVTGHGRGLGLERERTVVERERVL
jgi:hypothetical protein